MAQAYLNAANKPCFTKNVCSQMRLTLGLKNKSVSRDILMIFKYSIITA